MKLSRIGLVADFGDGIRRQLSTFRCGLGGCMEEIKQRVTHRPDFGQYQFGISGPLSRSAQSGPAQPLGESLSRAFGGSFYFSQFFGSQSGGRGLGAEAGYPLSKCDPHTNVIAFHQGLWERRDGTSLLFQAMRERVIERCFLLREGPQDYEIDRSLIDPIYGGSESFLTSDFEWLVYSSHESSIAVAGWVAYFFRAQWSDWGSVAYGGPFHTIDLCGSWEMPKP
jgi:hypothetical protein